MSVPNVHRSRYGCERGKKAYCLHKNTKLQTCCQILRVPYEWKGRGYKRSGEMTGKAGEPVLHGSLIQPCIVLTYCLYLARHRLQQTPSMKRIQAGLCLPRLPARVQPAKHHNLAWHKPAESPPCGDGAEQGNLVREAEQLLAWNTSPWFIALSNRGLFQIHAVERAEIFCPRILQEKFVGRHRSNRGERWAEGEQQPPNPTPNPQQPLWGCAWFSVY